jgi:hypothetical protein
MSEPIAQPLNAGVGGGMTMNKTNVQPGDGANVVEHAGGNHNIVDEQARTPEAATRRSQRVLFGVQCDVAGNTRSVGRSASAR